MNVYILTVMIREEDPYCPDYECIYGAYSTKEKAKEVAMDLQHKHESKHSNYLDLSGWKITECAVDADDGNIVGILLNVL